MCNFSIRDKISQISEDILGKLNIKICEKLICDMWHMKWFISSCFLCFKLGAKGGMCDDDDDDDPTKQVTFK